MYYVHVYVCKENYLGTKIEIVAKDDPLLL